MLAVEQYMVKYQLVVHIGLMCATGWYIMRPWGRFTKENMWC